MKKLPKIAASLLLIVAIAYLTTISHFHFLYPQTKWDWSKIDTKDVSFPKDFLWGTTTAAHQIEGNADG
jgi:beta-glucosidase